MTNYILIDGSYFIFYRFYALLNWWKLSKKNELLNIPIENEEFVSKFKKTFISKIQTLPHLLSIVNPIIIVGKDCKRCNIWRMKLLKTYKANRVYDDTFQGRPFFEMAYKTLYKEAGVHHILKQCSLEADDCIAITTKHLLKNPNNNVTIITSDTDYLQLIQDRVQIYNLKLKPIRTDKNSTGNALKDLFIKVVTGDKSDNIPKLFNRCGKKKAEYYFDNPQDFLQDLQKFLGDDYKQKLDLNINLIDFRNIPDDLVKEFTEECLSNL